jgi:hypothetical protein
MTLYVWCCAIVDEKKKYHEEAKKKQIKGIGGKSYSYAA